MDTRRISQNPLQDVRINVKLILASLWASLMFLIVYLDYFHLYMPGNIEDILRGRVFEFDISQGFLSIALAFVTIPALMIFLSVALPAKVNRWANIFVGWINIPLILFNLAGEAWVHMIIGAVIQVILLCLIIGFAWKWPRVET